MINKKNTLFNYFFICFFVLLLCIDLSQFFFLGTTIISIALASYCSLLFTTYTTMLIPFLFIFECLKSFCFYNYLFLPCIYLLPITIAARYLKRSFYPSLLYPALLSALSIIMQIYCIEKLFLQQTMHNNYTIIKIIVTIMITICFSLTIKMWVKRDNRI